MLTINKAPAHSCLADLPGSHVLGNKKLPILTHSTRPPAESKVSTRNIIAH